MTKRTPLNNKIKLASLFYHNDIECPLCGVFITSCDKIEWDHRTPLALGGADDETNIEAVHADCHRLKTSGSKATSYGSDIHAIAKVRRIQQGGRKRRGPPIKSRPFQKVKRHLPS